MLELLYRVSVEEEGYVIFFSDFFSEFPPPPPYNFKWFSLQSITFVVKEAFV